MHCKCLQFKVGNLAAYQMYFFTLEFNVRLDLNISSSPHYPCFSLCLNSEWVSFSFSLSFSYSTNIYCAIFPKLYLTYFCLSRANKRVSILCACLCTKNTLDWFNSTLARFLNYETIWKDALLKYWSNLPPKEYFPLDLFDFDHNPSM